MLIGHWWKLEGTTLLNKGAFWKSDDAWNFKTQDETVYIENASTAKVLGVETITDRVFHEVFDENNNSQMWLKGEESEDGFFTLTNPSSKKFLTATSSETLRVYSKCSRLKGKNVRFTLSKQSFFLLIIKSTQQGR